MAFENTDNLFDTNGFERMSRGFTLLGGRLPESALQTLAREVIARMAERRKLLRDSLRPLPDPVIERLCVALTGTSPTDAVSLVMDLRAEGTGVEQIYLGALAPAARRLGDWWDEDRATFAEVTIAIARVYGIMYGLRAEFPISLDPQRRHAVFAPVPGEDHTLGVSMAADLFRTHGWDIDLKLGLGHDALISAIAHADAPIIGLSLGQEQQLEPLVRLIVALRVTNPRSYILVAGQFVARHTDTLTLTGADAAAAEMPEALEAMEALWAAVQADAGSLGVSQ
jgi:methanogenic corrinoid protein MtbC1